MEILGSIDCASRVGVIDNQALYHLVFTADSVIVIRVLVRKDEFDKIKDRIKSTTEGAVTWTANSLTKAAQIKFFEEAMLRGREVEKILEEYIDAKPQGMEIIDYPGIARVEVSKGTMFGLPYVRFIHDNYETRFNLVRNIFEKAGKLDDDLFNQYRNTLKKAFGNKLKIKI